mmetsp:Transcript_5803/g.16787  ORF Transcript_5803/g.16787 Transcript_5803/m.16787 type:complete len:328 (-) Transcript_5803:121-1104(-)
MALLGDSDEPSADSSHGGASHLLHDRGHGEELWSRGRRSQSSLRKSRRGFTVIDINGPLCDLSIASTMPPELHDVLSQVAWMAFRDECNDALSCVSYCARKLERLKALVLLFAVSYAGAALAGAVLAQAQFVVKAALLLSAVGWLSCAAVTLSCAGCRKSEQIAVARSALEVACEKAQARNPGMAFRVERRADGRRGMPCIEIEWQLPSKKAADGADIEVEVCSSDVALPAEKSLDCKVKVRESLSTEVPPSVVGKLSTEAEVGDCEVASGSRRPTVDGGGEENECHGRGHESARDVGGLEAPAQVAVEAQGTPPPDNELPSGSALE